MLLHERLVPYVRAAAADRARVRPADRPPGALTRRGGWTLADAYGYGPSLCVAPVLEDGAREREVDAAARRVDRRVERASASRRRRRSSRRRRCTRIPVWVRRGALIVTYPAEHVARGLGDTPERERPLEATLWGEPPCGRAVARLADGTVDPLDPRRVVGLAARANASSSARGT